MTPADPRYLRTRTLPCAGCGEDVPHRVLFCARCDAVRPSILPIIGHALALLALAVVLVAGFMAIGAA